MKALTKETRDALLNNIRNPLPKIKGPTLPEGNQTYENVMRFVFKGTDIEEIAKYPLRGKSNF